jgi:hypothetical protein
MTIHHTDTAALRALYEADKFDKECPKCGKEAFVSDCWQIDMLEHAPDMLDEIDALRAALTLANEAFRTVVPFGTNPEARARSRQDLDAARAACMDVLPGSPSTQMEERT